MRVLRLLLPVLALAACGGLLFDQSNAFPCDFSLAPGARDAVCAPGDVCGVDNRCQRFVYEGPQFEGTPTLPEFTPAAGAGRVVHPRKLNHPVTAVSRGVTPLGKSLLVALGDAGTVLLRRRGDVATNATDVSGALQVMYLESLSGQSDRVIAIDAAGTTQVLESGVQPRPILRGPGDAVRLTRLHGAPSPLDLPLFSLVGGVDELGAAGRIDLLGNTWRFSPLGLPADAGAAVDVGLLPRSAGPVPLAVTTEGVFLPLDSANPGLGFFNATAGSGVRFTSDALVRLDGRGQLLAVAGARQPGVGGTLGLASVATYSVVRAGNSYALEEPWPACAPCDLDALAAISPLVTGAGPAVEVLCVGKSARRLLRVVGSQTVGNAERCRTETMDPPVALEDIALLELPGSRSLVVGDFGLQTGVALGGLQGQVWRGESLSSMLPEYLERVPLDVALGAAGNEGVAGESEVLVALTDRYLAIDEDVAGAQAGKLNGLRRADFSVANALVGEDVRPSALVHESGGWVVLSTGELSRFVPRVESDGGVGGVELGPRLVNGLGQTVERALSGEAYVSAAGELRSMLVAADDSLYFDALKGLPLADGGAAPTVTRPATLTPVLTPEPNVRVRHLTLERTPIATDGVTKLRGYVVTSRSVFQFAYGGSPARWTATPLLLAGAAPSEVWFDHPRGGLARVGYSDGQVFSLPGGFQLAEALPGTEEGTPRVVDYENLAGWPVALTDRGLFVAGWDLLPPAAEGKAAKLDNKFSDGGVNKPMTWREVALPDGSKPWMRADGTAKPGRLFVRAGAEVQVNGLYQRPFTLMLFLDHGVLVVGQHTRVNSGPR